MISDPVPSPTHYDRLGLHPSASAQEIRQAYRELSRQYHPDTTALPPAIATAKFQALNAAYAVLSNPERRAQYDRTIGSYGVVVTCPQPPLSQNNRDFTQTSSAYLDPTDRPLSGGELFVLLILGLTFAGCLLLVVVIGLTRDPLSLAEHETSPHRYPPLQSSLTRDRAVVGIPRL